MQYSKYQEAVFQFADAGSGHGCVEAVSGSGKTTTGIEMVQKFNCMEQGLFTSFTRVIVDELANRIKAQNLRNITAKTYNAFGAGLIFKNMKPAPKLLTDYNGQKTDLMLKSVLGNIEDGQNARNYYKSKTAIIRFVSMFKALNLNLSEANNQFERVVEDYDLDVPEIKGFKTLFLDTYNKCLNTWNVIDFDDQKFLPVYKNWDIPQYDFLVIDEFQDTCPIESELMLRACKGGRIIVFGDRNQAIYSFKGTTPNSMQQFIAEKRATALPLSICYRCPINVVKEAQKIVPQIEWAPDAIEGAVDTIDKQKYEQQAGPNDMVLARVTQDLVKSVMKFLKQGRAAYIEGREYGTQLKYFIDTCLGDYSESIDIFRFKEVAEQYYMAKHAELTKLNKENQAQQLESRYESTEVLLEGCTNVAGLKKKIDTIFTDKGSGVRHLTGHKSKGLEGKKDGDVYILRPDKIPHARSKNPEEEMRLKYVMITRTRRNLYWVKKDKDEK